MSCVWLKHGILVLFSCQKTGIFQINDRDFQMSGFPASGKIMETRYFNGEKHFPHLKKLWKLKKKTTIKSWNLKKKSSWKNHGIS